MLYNCHSSLDSDGSHSFYDHFGLILGHYQKRTFLTAHKMAQRDLSTERTVGLRTVTRDGQDQLGIVRFITGHDQFATSISAFMRTKINHYSENVSFTMFYDGLTFLLWLYNICIGNIHKYLIFLKLQYIY